MSGANPGLQSYDIDLFTRLHRFELIVDIWLGAALLKRFI